MIALVISSGSIVKMLSESSFLKYVIIIFILLTACSVNKKEINPWTTIVKQILTNGVGR